MVTSFRSIAGFSLNARIVLSYTLAKGLTLAIQGLVYNLFLLSLHFSPALIGLLDAMPAVTVLVLGVPMGVLADRIGRRSLLLWCGFLNPVSLLGLALFTDPAGQIGFGLANGMLGSFYWIAYPAMIMESSNDDNRQLLFSLNSMLMLGVGSLGYIIGGSVTSIAAGVLHQSAGSTEPLRWAMISMAVVGLLGAIPLVWLREEPRRVRGPHEARRRYNLGLFARLLGPDALLSFGAGAVLSFNQLYFATVYGLAAGPLGVFLTLAGVVGALGALASPPLVRRLGQARAAISLQAGSVALIVALALAPGLAVAMGVYAVWWVIRSAIDPTYTGFAMAQAPADQRSTLSGLYSVTWAVGFSSGPFATGWLRDLTHGFTVPFLLAAVCYGVASVLLYVFFVRGRRAAAVVAGAAGSAAAR